MAKIISEATNFHEIFSLRENEQSIKKIVIPIVQRDYAQGRKSHDVTRIRNRFLQVLFEALTSDKKITLDFIYGNVDDEGALIPLDGQQRLTTLFLLHYYIAKHENIEEKEQSFLQKFTYRTRISSRNFCEKLIYFTPDFSSEDLSSQIIDQAWFLMEWENDPTVKSMLVMLDAIHLKFVTTDNLWPRLKRDAIRFYFLPLSEMGVTDELYIKMNSRGKALTLFEHVKAEFQLKTKEVDENLSARIMNKIDQNWTDILWPFRNSETGDKRLDNIVDDEFLRYLLFISDIIQYRDGKQSIKDYFDIIDSLFSKNNEEAENNILLLEKFFDIWNGIDINDFFSNYISKEGYKKDKIFTDNPVNIFRHCCSSYGESLSHNRSAFPLSQTLLLYSFIIYLLHKEKISDQDFRRRLRIVNNLIRNSQDTVRIDYMKTLLRIVKRIILEGVIENGEGRARFQSRQVEEEIKKLEWTTNNPEKAEVLFRLEDHPYVNGFISTIGLENIDWVDRFYSLFQCDLDLVSCALLANGDYFVKDSWRFQIGTSDSRASTRVWREIFGPIKSEQNLVDALHSLLSKYESFSDEILRQEVDNYLKTASNMPVRYYIAKYSQMRPNRFGKYYWFNHKVKGRNSYHVLMMQTELSVIGANYDIFLKTLYELAGGKERGLLIGNYSYTEYNNNGEDKLYLQAPDLYLTLIDDTYRIYNERGGERFVLDERPIRQDENGLDIEDRVAVGLEMIEKYIS